MQAIFVQLFVLYVFLLLGWVLGKWKSDYLKGTGLLSALLVNIFLPAKLFLSLNKNFTVAYIREKYVLLLAGTAALLVVVGISFLVGKLLTKEDYKQKIYRYSLTLSNYAYLGYVLMENLYGSAALSDMILFCIPFALYTYTFGFWMLTRAKRSAKRLLNPLILSLVLGIVFGLVGITLPDAVSSVFSMASACVGPIGMLLTGIVLSAISFKELFTNKIDYIVIAVRLLALPLLAFGVCRLFSLDAVMLPMLFVACMPCGLNTVIFPKFVGEDTATGARLALLSHLISCVTIPFWLFLIA